MKFTTITPENLDMSRLVMSVVSAAVGGGQGGDDSGDDGDNLVRNIYIYKKRQISLNIQAKNDKVDLRNYSKQVSI